MIKLIMREISGELARYFFNGSILEVFRIYPDGTEGLVLDIEDIYTHEGIFGIQEYIEIG